MSLLPRRRLLQTAQIHGCAEDRRFVFITMSSLKCELTVTPVIAKLLEKEPHNEQAISLNKEIDRELTSGACH